MVGRALDLDASEIVNRRFSRKLFGADLVEVRQLLAEAAVTYDRTKAVLAQVAAERDALQQELREATAEVRQLREQTESLRRQAAAAQEAVAAREAQEHLLAEAVAERDALQQKLREATAEVHQLREQTGSLRRQAAATQAPDSDAQASLLGEAIAGRNALQQRLQEVTGELLRLRERTGRLQAQAAAAQEAVAAREAQERLLAETVAERDALQQKLREATAEVHQLREQTGSLRRQAAAAQEQVASYRTQEHLIAQVLVTAQRAADDLARKAQAQAEDTIARASAASEETIESARKSAAETLRRAQARADQAVRAVADLATRIEAFVSGRQLLRNLASLTEGLTEALGVLGHLQTGLQNEVSALRDLARTIKEEEADLRGPAAAGPPPSPPPGALARSSSGRQGLDGSDRPAERDRVVSVGVRGEVTISPVSQHYQAARMVAAISRLKGIRSARLRALTNNTACIELAAEAASLGDMDFTVIDGVPMEVVEATDTRLVLRIARPFAEAFRG